MYCVCTDNHVNMESMFVCKDGGAGKEGASDTAPVQETHACTKSVAGLELSTCASQLEICESESGIAIRPMKERTGSAGDAELSIWKSRAKGEEACAVVPSLQQTWIRVQVTPPRIFIYLVILCIII